MKIDLNKYNVEIINDKGIWIGLEDGLNVEVGICVLSNNYGVVSRYIESIYIDCFIDGTATTMSLPADSVKFIKK